MKTIITLLLLTILYSCGSDTKHLETPFIIVQKDNNNCTLYPESCQAQYWYQDRKGNRETFYDFAYKYNIGDTL